LASCNSPKRQGETELSIESEDSLLSFRCDGKGSRDEWFKRFTDAIDARNKRKAVMFDPTEHMQGADADAKVELLLEPQMEVSASAKKEKKKDKKKGKTKMAEVVLRMTTDGIWICDPVPIDHEVAQKLPADQIVTIDKDDEVICYQVNTLLTYQRIRTWALEEDGACCKVEMSSPPLVGGSHEFKFYSSAKTTANDVLEGVQRCIASLMLEKKREKERREKIRGDLVELFEKYATDRVNTIDAIMAAHPGDKLEKTLQDLQAELASKVAPNVPERPIVPARPHTAQAAQKCVVTIETHGPLGIAFGAEHEDQLGWIASITPGGAASKFPELKEGLLLTEVNGVAVQSHKAAVNAIKAGGRPLHLVFESPPNSSEESPVDSALSIEPVQDQDGSDLPPESPRGMGRWILTYTNLRADEAIDAVQLETYNVEQPASPQSEYAYEAVLNAVGQDGNIHTLSLAVGDATVGAGLGLSLCKHAAAAKIDPSSVIHWVTDAQEDFLNSDDTIDFQMSEAMDSVRDTGRDSSLSDMVKAAAANSKSGAANNGAMVDVIAHYDIHVQELDGTFGLGAFDICRLQMQNIRSDFWHTQHGAVALNANLGTALLIDLYSRGTVCSSIISEPQSANSERSVALEFDADLAPLDLDNPTTPAPIVKSGVLAHAGKSNYFKLVPDAFVICNSDQEDSPPTGALALPGARIHHRAGDAYFTITRGIRKYALQAGNSMIAAEWKTALEGCIEVGELLSTDISSDQPFSEGPANLEPFSRPRSDSLGSPRMAASPSSGRDDTPRSSATTASPTAGEISGASNDFLARDYQQSEGAAQPLLQLHYEMTRWPPELAQLNECVVSFSTVLQPVRIMLNAALVPMINAFFSFTADFAGTSNVSVIEMLLGYHGAAANSDERRRVDIRILAPEIVVPEVVDASIADALVLVVHCAEIAIQNDFSPDLDSTSIGSAVDKFTFTAVDQAIYMGKRDEFLKIDRAPDLFVGKEILLSPFTLNAAVRWAPECMESSEGRFTVQCESEAIRLRLSSNAMRNLLIVAAHAGEAMTPNHSSIAGILKKSLTTSTVTVSGVAESDGPPKQSLAAKIRSYLGSKMVPDGTGTDGNPTPTPASPHTAAEDMVLDFDAREAARAGSQIHQRSLICASVVLKSFDVAVAMDEDEFGVRAAGLTYDLDIRPLDRQNKWTIEQFEVTRNASDEGNDSSSPIFTAAPSLGLSVLRIRPGSSHAATFGDASTVSIPWAQIYCYN
jgi:hypothetical protein